MVLNRPVELAAVIVHVICMVRVFNDENCGANFLLVFSSNLRDGIRGQAGGVSGYGKRNGREG
jgi:hypothetical protein